MMRAFEILPKTVRRFGHAIDGVMHLLTADSSYIKHLFAAVTVLAVGLAVGLTRMEWIVIILSIGLVLVSEAFNSALEALADKITTEYDSAIKLAKDIAAAGVLVGALTALVVGLIIFVHIIQNL